MSSLPHLFRNLIICFGILLFIYLIIVSKVWLNQDNLLYPGMNIPPSIQKFNATVKSHQVLHGWIENAESKKALVFFGGNNMSLEPFRDVLKECTDRAIYLFPYQGFEGQAGKPSEKSMIADGLAIFNQAKKDHPDGVAVAGVSLGSGVAVQVASQVDAEHLLLLTPYDSILNVAKTHFSWLPVSLLLRDDFNSATYAPKIKIPVYVLRGKYDTVVFPKNTDNLLKSFTAPVFVETENTGHNGIWDVLNGKQTCDFIKTALNSSSH